MKREKAGSGLRGRKLKVVRIVWRQVPTFIDRIMALSSKGQSEEGGLGGWKSGELNSGLCRASEIRWIGARFGDSHEES